MIRLFGYAVVFLATASFAMAVPASVPEIDASSAGSAIALLGGGLMVLRARRSGK